MLWVVAEVDRAEVVPSYAFVYAEEELCACEFLFESCGEEVERVEGGVRELAHADVSYSFVGM